MGARSAVQVLGSVQSGPRMPICGARRKAGLDPSPGALGWGASCPSAFCPTPWAEGQPSPAPLPPPAVLTSIQQEYECTCTRRPGSGSSSSSRHASPAPALPDVCGVGHEGACRPRPPTRVKHTSSHIPLPDHLDMGRPGPVGKAHLCTHLQAALAGGGGNQTPAPHPPPGRKPGLAARWELGRGRPGTPLCTHALALWLPLPQVGGFGGFPP